MHSANPNRGNASSLRNRLKTAESPVVHASEVDNRTTIVPERAYSCVDVVVCLGSRLLQPDHSTMHAHFWTCI